MALLKQIDTTAGASASYWRITRASYDYAGGRVVFEIEGYVSEEARRGGKTPLTAMHFDTLHATEAKSLYQVSVADMYEHAKAALPGLIFDCVADEARFDTAEDA